LRLLRLVRAFSGFYRAAMHIQGLARHRAFAWLIVALLSVTAVTSVWFYVAEHGVNKFVDSPFDALWWGVTTMTTVAYGDVIPSTPEGKFAAMALMILGVGLFSAITASITSYFISTERAAGLTGASLAERLVALSDLRRDGSLTDEEFVAAKAAEIASLPLTQLEMVAGDPT